MAAARSNSCRTGPQSIPGRPHPPLPPPPLTYPRAGAGGFVPHGERNTDPLPIITGLCIYRAANTDAKRWIYPEQEGCTERSCEALTDGPHLSRSSKGTLGLSLCDGLFFSSSMQKPVVLFLKCTESSCLPQAAVIAEDQAAFPSPQRTRNQNLQSYRLRLR